jgi:hypothetical protein
MVTMHVVVRNYRGNAKLMDVIEQNRSEVERLLRGVPGFVAYYLIRSADGGASISVYQDQAGTQESTRLAGEWIRQNAPEAAGTPPEVTEGETIIQFSA